MGIPLKDPIGSMATASMVPMTMAMVEVDELESHPQAPTTSFMEMVPVNRSVQLVSKPLTMPLPG